MAFPESKIAIEYYHNWHYEDALQWMIDRREDALLNGNMTIGLGQHSKPLITLGRHTDGNQVLDSDRARRDGIAIYRIDRGGGATMHGPGQLVLYPVVNLFTLRIGTKELTHALEEAMIQLLLSISVIARRAELGPGVYVDNA